MKIIFDTIKIENFLSIGNAEVDLKDKGFCLVNGINKNPKDASKSNGSGKSSIFEAIAWCLTGETIRGAKNVVNMFGDDGALVELSFTIDNNKYLLRRSKEHKKYKNDLKIFINGEDKSGKTLTDSKKLLESYIPDLNPSLIGSVILLGQGLPQRFTNNTPAGRKEVLEKLSKSDFMIEDLKKRIIERNSYLNKELRLVEDKILENSSTIATLESQIKQCQKQLSELEDPSIYIELIDKSKERISRFESQIKEFQDQLNSNKDKLLELNLKKQSIESEIKKDQELENLEYLDKKHSLDSLKLLKSQRLDSLKKEVAKAKSIKDICPTCGRKFDNVYIPDTSKEEKEIDSINTELKKLEEEFNQLFKTHNEYTLNFNNIIKEKTQEISLEISKVQAHISNYEKSITSVNLEKTTELKSLSQCEKLLSGYQATIDTLNNTINTNQKSIEEINVNSVYIYGRKEDVSKRLDIIKKFSTIANRDFRGYLLKNIIQYINSKAKNYCKEIFGTEEIEFTLEGNNIDISYSGKEYAVLSGGEKQKIDLIVQLSLRDMLCQFLDFRCNILALDEIFDGLDATSCTKVVDLISKKLSDVGSIFIITHHQDLNIPCDSTITVIKQENGVSSVW